jgi:hypothetical protein
VSCSKGRPGGYSREAQRHQETGAQHRSAQRLPPPHTPTHTLTRTSPLAFCPPSSVPPSSRPIFPLIISRSAAKNIHCCPAVELAQLFQDMAILVESQGELINSIDNNGPLPRARNAPV